ncbi:hypothetical protein MG3_02344 [Candida albicans P78048]|uniref:Protein BIG1 n=2 Tax=Candida albicans TaxID=5476 RepID=Q875I7_CANAX|nr:unknown [Candida albicans]KGR13910.1 hypothetical protein MG3_02344 [Candida albicans P78048]KGR20748.1 hypothetical protein MG9_02340 [Candida albicans P37037]KGT70312.1 hypothetical protein MEK_02338 [Candida albicans 12C]KGU12928.1 hypothetical protein MEY_02343 [Candida albicans 19F]
MVSLSNLLVCLGLVVVPTTLAFSDTAPIIIHSNNQDALESNHKYITKFVDVKSKVDEIIKESCSDKNSKLFIYQIEDLSIESDYSWLLNKGSYANVLYHEKNEANYDFNGKCEEKESGTVQFSVLKTGSLQEIYEKHKENKNEVFIIQVLPKFTSGHSLKAIKEKMYNLYNDEDIVISSKRDKQSDNENDAEIEQEIERDFEVAESLASEESDPVSIFDTDKQNKNGTVVKHDNLFTKYQFFTSGIWSGIIISGFLLVILYNALSWLSSLEITYASFEKQIDFDKKNE